MKHCYTVFSTRGTKDGLHKMANPKKRNKKWKWALKLKPNIRRSYIMIKLSQVMSFWIDPNDLNMYKVGQK